MEQGDVKKKSVSKNKTYSRGFIVTISALGYILFFLPLIFCRKEPYARFHLNQSIVLLIFVGILYLSFAFIPNVNRIAIPLVILIHLLAILIGMSNASKGRAKIYPVIGRIKIIKWNKI